LSGNREKWEYSGTVYQLFIHFEKAYNSVRREILYNILNYWYMVSMKMGYYSILSETYSEVRVGKILSNTFPIRNFLKQGDVYRYCFSILI